METESGCGVSTYNKNILESPPILIENTKLQLGKDWWKALINKTDTADPDQADGFKLFYRDYLYRSDTRDVDGEQEIIDTLRDHGWQHTAQQYHTIIDNVIPDPKHVPLGDSRRKLKYLPMNSQQQLLYNLLLVR